MKITFKMWLWIFAILLSLVSIFVFVTTNPVGISFLQKGVIVTSVTQNTTIFDSGLRSGMVIKKINGKPIDSIDEYSAALEPFIGMGENETRNGGK